MTVRRKQSEDPKAEAVRHSLIEVRRLFRRACEEMQDDPMSDRTIDDFCRGYEDLDLLPEERKALEADLSEIHSLLLEWNYLLSR